MVHFLPKTPGFLLIWVSLISQMYATKSPVCKADMHNQWSLCVYYCYVSFQPALKWVLHSELTQEVNMLGSSETLSHIHSSPVAEIKPCKGLLLYVAGTYNLFSKYLLLFIVTVIDTWHSAKCHLFTAQNIWI